MIGQSQSPRLSQGAESLGARSSLQRDISPFEPLHTSTPQTFGGRMDTLHRTDKAKSGVPGLDDVMSGGFTRGCLFLLEGNPGTGKTTMALRFLLEGAAFG